ncbi:MAG: DUF4175 family protein [Myxococcota bacterium]
MRRTRVLLGLKIAARTALLLLAVLMWGTLASVIRLDRPTAALVAVTLAGIGGWIALALPLLVDWRATGDAVGHARRVEGIRPDLRGRLLTAVEHTRGAAQPGESEALVGLVLRRAVGRIAGLAPGEVYPARPAVRVAATAGAAWLVGLALLLLAGPGDVARFWFASGAARAEVDGIEVRAAEDLARVGDIVVRYTYPDYTGLPPKEVPNGTGDVSAVPGTTVEIEARSADEMQAAGLVAYDERLEAQVGDDARSLSGTFSVRKEEGTYHLLVYRGAEPERSRDFAVTPVEDLPPDVMLDLGTEGTFEVALDGAIPVQWQARDDFGVRRVGVALDGKDTDKVLERPDTRRAELGGRAMLYPKDFGLGPGDRVKLSVVAWDNDTVSGSKRGESQSVEIVVLGANGVQEQVAQRRAELLEKMIPVLARFLTDPSPPGVTGGQLVTWGEAVANRYQPLSEAVEKLWAGMQRNTQDRAIVEAVLDSGRKLVRYTQTSFEPGSAEVPRDDAAAMTTQLRDEAVTALEDGILAFLTLQRNEALGEIVQLADQLDNAADDVQEMLSKEDPDTQELLSKLDQLERTLAQMAKAASDLEESGLKEFLNLRDNEASNLMEEIRKAIAEGRLDEARKMMERLSQLMKEMSQGVKDEMDRRMQEGDDAQQSAEDLKAELEQIEKDQRQLQSEVQALRQSDRDAADQLAKLWAQLERKAEEHATSATEYRDGLEKAERKFFEQERASGGVDEADALRGAIAARDVSGARNAVNEGMIAWAGAMHALEIQLGRGPLDGPGRRELGQLLGQLDEIEELLKQLEQAESQVDPETLQKAQQMEGQQRDLENRLKQSMEKAKSLEQQFPVRPQGMQEALDEAQDRMQQASEDLGEGQPMQAEGSQGVAAQRVRDAIESIEQAQQQARQQAQQMQGGQGEGEQKQDGNQEHDGSGDLNQALMEIPGREEFRTPEEYRRALLEGMEGDVPEEYRAMKQRYFEELVHQ